MATTAKLNSGHYIPRVGLGVWQTSNMSAASVVYDALEVGYRHVDSAAIYHNEREAGEGILNFLKDHKEVKRADIFYTTKVWDSDHGYENTLRAVQTSLDKVKGLGYIDLVLIHSPQSSAAERWGTWRALEESVERGLVKSIGVSNFGIHHIREILAHKDLKIKPAVNQIELTPWLQRTALTEYCFANGIAVEAYSPLTRGQRLKDPTLVKLAHKYHKSPAQILVHWSVQKGFIPLPKSVHKNRMIENFDVFDFEMSKEDFDSLGDPNAYFLTGWDPSVKP